MDARNEAMTVAIEGEQPSPMPNAPSDVSQRVRQLITGMIADGRGSPSIAAVSGMVGTSVRTLQRRLRESGLTYGDVVQHARAAAAQRMLEDRHVRIGDVARVLGYSDPAHFTRAFHRWTGVTPREFRWRRWQA